VTVEFVVGPEGKVTALKQVDPSGEFVSRGSNVHGVELLPIKHPPTK
jgi:hypothetical protein